MHMINDHARNEYIDDAVVARGFAIYDEWIAKKFTSRKIVAYVELAVANAKQNKGTDASMELLACLFALDVRIKENYNTLLHRIFSYFPWRRETRAFKLLKGALNIPSSDLELRTVIEIELQSVREKLERKDTDDEDDNIRGGKSNGKPDEERVVSEEKMQYQTVNEKKEDISDIKETKESAEKMAEDIAESVKTQGHEEEIKVVQNAKEVPNKDMQTTVQKNEEQSKEEFQEIKVENNGPDEKSKPSTDKTQETKTYNDAIDSPSLYEQFANNHSAIDSQSFIDEVIKDNMLKWKEDVIRHNPLTQGDQIRDVNRTENAGTQNCDENKNADENEYLYDNMVTSDKGGAQLAATIAEAKTARVDVAAQNGNVAINGQASDDLRVPLQVDITLDQENEMRREISNSMSAEEIKAIYESQASAMREHLTIASAELGMDAPVEIIGKPESTQIEQTSAVSNRK